MSKISSGAIMLAFVAVLVGLLGAYVVREVLSRPRTVRRARAPETITVPMASMELQPGRKVALGDVALAKMTRQEMKERGISRAFMTDSSQIIGRVLKKKMKRGDRFDTTLFYPDGMGPGLVERLEAGKRAVTIPAWPEDALLGFAGPGSHVDVIFRSGYGNQDNNNGFRFNTDRYTDNPAFQDYAQHWAGWNGGRYGYRGQNHHRSFEQTVTLLENVQVLAIDRETFEGMNVQSARTERMNVTLAVTPEQAASLRVVDGRGELALSLRNPEDEATVDDSAPKTLGDIIDVPAMPLSIRTDMETYRGFQRGSVQFRGNDLGSRASGSGSRGWWSQMEPETPAATNREEQQVAKRSGTGLTLGPPVPAEQR